ncbi:hypothetical protein SLS62_008726 [Diatrype stigma]|uniref:Uncharacterized protein n=1 Tax=Diatrype stigma TaxID=117547 RepID=A0AAN9YL76_9PEZI
MCLGCNNGIDDEQNDDDDATPHRGPPINGPIHNKIRSSQGCWTCRPKPVCAVSPLSGDRSRATLATRSSPGWTAARARPSLVGELRARVKAKANERRERR